MCHAALEEQLATAHEQHLTKESHLSAAQADFARVTQDKQALQRRLQTNHDELGHSLQQLQGLRLDIQQREADHKDRCQVVAQLLLAKEKRIEVLEAQLHTQAGKTSGMVVTSVSVDVAVASFWRFGTYRPHNCGTTLRCILLSAATVNKTSHQLEHGEVPIQPVGRSCQDHVQLQVQRLGWSLHSRQMQSRPQN